MKISRTKGNTDKKGDFLSGQELNEVIRQYKQADAEGDTYKRDQLFAVILESNSKLIYRVMHAKYPTFVKAYSEDMMQFCATELFTILPNYDPDKGVFSTYFTPSIVHACQQFINELNGYTVYYGTQIYKIKRYLAEADLLNLPVTPLDIADATKIPIHTVNKCMEILQAQDAVAFNPADEAIDKARGFDKSSEEEIIEREEKEAIMKSLDMLNPRARKILKLKYGFGRDGKTMTDIAIAKDLGISKQTVRRIISDAQLQLRGILKKSSLFTERTIRHEIEELSKNVVFIPRVTEEDTAEADMFMQMNETVF